MDYIIIITLFLCIRKIMCTRARMWAAAGTTCSPHVRDHPVLYMNEPGAGCVSGYFPGTSPETTALLHVLRNCANIYPVHIAQNKLER